MNSRIIFPSDDGGVSVIIPAAERGLTIEEIAAQTSDELKALMP